MSNESSKPNDPIPCPRPVPLGVLQFPELSSAEIAILSKKAMYSEYTTIVRQAIRQGIEDGSHPLPPSIQHAFEAVSKGASEKSSSTSHVLITVNPQSDDLPELIRRMEKFVSKKWVDDIYYCYEQRSEEGAVEWYGYHVHMFLPKNGKVNSAIMTETRNTFKSLVPDEKNLHHINFKWIKFSDIDKVMNYITGVKADPDKMDKQIQDFDWRVDNSLDQFYHIKKNS